MGVCTYVPVTQTTVSSSVRPSTRTDQAASFSEVTKETAVQREGQLIALAQL